MRRVARRKPSSDTSSPTARFHPQVHHRDRQPANNNPENLVTLCTGCHLSYHQGQKGNITPGQLSLPLEIKPQYLALPVFRQQLSLAIHISYALSVMPARVLLVDADPQGSARDWATARKDEPPFTVVGLDLPTIHRDLPNMAKNYDHVVIDGPPRVSELARSAIAAADLVLIPVQPSPYDVWAAQETIDLINEASVIHRNYPPMVNRYVSSNAQRSRYCLVPERCKGIIWIGVKSNTIVSVFPNC